MKNLTLLTVLFTVFLFTSCGNQNTNANCSNTANETKTMKKFQKKYTNADFYTDGKFNEDVALKAMKEMLEFYNVKFSPFMEENFWVADFGLGDFENTGMGGIFWVNDEEHAYFGHGIYLLPGQMIPEHNHVKTNHPAKFESWMVNHGWCYNFSEVGAETPNAPALPETQKSTIRSKNWIRMEEGDIAHLKETESYHFLYAGDEGLIVTEFANFHDGGGLTFTNPKAKM